MATFPAGPMEVVFSFDTTGSMSQVLDEVKARVTDIIQRLQSDIPGFKVGIIAHGDYCDAHHFYDIKTLDLTNNLADVVMFINNTEGTGGGDIPECYELALRNARDMSWTPGSRRVVVVIGDAYPHGADYEMNKLNIDWTQELDNLVKKGIRIYGVQVGDDPESTSFFTKLTTDSGGQHLKLADMSTICQVIMGICYREHGAEMFLNYEKEVRAERQRNFGPDLEAVFGALRVDESRSNGVSSDRDNDVRRVNSKAKSSATSLSPNNGHSYRSLLPISRVQNCSIKLTETARVEQLLKKGAKKSKSTVKTASTSNSKRRRDKLEPGARKEKTTNLAASHKTCEMRPQNMKHMSLPAGSTNEKTSVTKQSHNAKSSVTSVTRITNKKLSRNLSRPRRESVSLDDFKYNNLPWSTWHKAVSQEKPNLPGLWKAGAKKRCGAFWKKDLLNPLVSKLETYSEATTVFELGLKKQHRSSLKVVYFRATNVCRRAPFGIFGIPWYSGLFKTIRELLASAVFKEYNVYMRYAIVTKELKKQIPREYNYLWLTGRQE